MLLQATSLQIRRHQPRSPRSQQAPQQLLTPLLLRVRLVLPKRRLRAMGTCRRQATEMREVGRASGKKNQTLNITVTQSTPQPSHRRVFRLALRQRARIRRLRKARLRHGMHLDPCHRGLHTRRPCTTSRRLIGATLSGGRRSPPARRLIRPTARPRHGTGRQGLQKIGRGRHLSGRTGAKADTDGHLGGATESVIAWCSMRPGV